MNGGRKELEKQRRERREEERKNGGEKLFRNTIPSIHSDFTTFLFNFHKTLLIQPRKLRQHWVQRSYVHLPNILRQSRDKIQLEQISSEVLPAHTQLIY